ncbi:TniQ family protein [Streptosporangium sandarakinum]|uniref:TniQ family protein n=1 Tax=Streptosporangium sandarakinum TaxID=1260955 RepID=UPI00372181F9
MVSRLPIAVSPAQHEIAYSYLTRLAALHGMPFSELWHQVSRPRPGGTTRRIAADLLAAATNLPEPHLRRALIELRGSDTDWLALRHEPQRACPRCTARHPGGPVLQLLPHYRYVCPRHRIWIGPPDLRDHPYPILDGLVEVVAAQRAHLRLLHRLGPAATYDAVLTGFLICGHRWDNPAAGPADVRLVWGQRAEQLIPSGTEDVTYSASRLFAATYPEAVKIAALIGSLHWRRLAAGGPDDQRRFTSEIARRLGDPDYRPRITLDPIAHWIDSDSWQPPSLPVNTYNTQRTFGGPAFPKPNQHSHDRNQRSAYWFALNRQGGRGILYHRHLHPVMIRDWSIPMDLFAGTVHASADTRNYRPRNAHGLSEYLRPFPTDSAYLATATSSAPWPVRITPCQTHRPRPSFGRERKTG